KQLYQVELEDLGDKMLATIERAKKEDPKELRREIAQLKAELLKAGKPQPLATSKVVEKPVLKDSQITLLQKTLNRVEPILARLSEVGSAFKDVGMQIRTAIAETKSNQFSTHSPAIARNRSERIDDP